MRIPWLCVLVFSGFVAPLNSQEAPVGVQRYLEGLSEYRFRLLEKSADLERGAGDFSRPLLEEYALQSYSRWRFQKPGASSLVMEVYEMLHQQGAFGMYRLDSVLRPTTGDRLELPVENRCGESGCIFWRGPFLFRLTAKPGAQASDQIKGAVAALVEAIPIVNLHPVTVLHLPRQDLVTDSVGVYLGPAALAYNDRFPDPLMAKIGFQDRVEIASIRRDRFGSRLRVGRAQLRERAVEARLRARAHVPARATGCRRDLERDRLAGQRAEHPPR